jgi:hypothetical protein
LGYRLQLGILLLLIGAGIFVLVYGMWLKAARTEKLARLYTQAMEKGIDPRAIRFELEDQEASDPQGNLKAGVFLLARASSAASSSSSARAGGRSRPPRKRTSSGMSTKSSSSDEAPTAESIACRSSSEWGT